MGVNTYISIGNSDDRLTQSRWSDFISDVRGLLLTGEWRDRLQIHGEWFSAPDQPWQNANWCVEILPPAWWARASAPDGPKGAWVRAQAVIARDVEMDENRNRLKERVRDLCLHYSQDTFAWTTGTVELVKTGWVDPVRSDPVAYLEAENDRQARQAIAEGWLPPGKTHLSHEDRTNLIHGGPPPQPTLGEDEDSTPPAPASTGDGKPWARTEDELRSTERKRAGGISA